MTVVGSADSEPRHSQGQRPGQWLRTSLVAAAVGAALIAGPVTVAAADSGEGSTDGGGTTKSAPAKTSDTESGPSRNADNDSRDTKDDSRQTAKNDEDGGKKDSPDSDHSDTAKAGVTDTAPDNADTTDADDADDATDTGVDAGAEAAEATDAVAETAETGPAEQTENIEEAPAPVRSADQGAPADEGLAGERAAAVELPVDTAPAEPLPAPTSITRSSVRTPVSSSPAPAAAADAVIAPPPAATPPAGAAADADDPVPTAAAPAAAADIDYGVGSGATVGLLPGVFGTSSQVMRTLQGSLCAAPNTCQRIRYFNLGDLFGSFFGRLSMKSGIKNLNNWIAETPGQKIVLGHSFGALVAYQWLRTYSSDPNAPSPDELSFVTLAAPERNGTGYAYFDPNGIFRYRVADGLGIPLDTPYQVVDVCRKWDGWCYWVPGDDRSRRGKNKLHVDYSMVDVNDPANEVTQDGNVTFVLVPTEGWG